MRFGKGRRHEESPVCLQPVADDAGADRTSSALQGSHQVDDADFLVLAGRWETGKDLETGLGCCSTDKHGGLEGSGYELNWARLCPGALG